MLGIVGESGSGKSVTNLTLMGLLPGKNVQDHRHGAARRPRPAEADAAELRQVRGNDVAMIFQDPMTSLNPVHTIGDQLIEAVHLHQRRLEGRRRARGPSRC